MNVTDVAKESVGLRTSVDCFAMSTVVELIGRPHLDMFQQDRFIFSTSTFILRLFQPRTTLYASRLLLTKPLPARKTTRQWSSLLHLSCTQNSWQPKQNLPTGNSSARKWCVCRTRACRSSICQFPRIKQTKISTMCLRARCQTW